MSIESPSKVTALSDFNVNGVLSQLYVQPHEKTKIAAIRYFYKNICDDDHLHNDRAQNQKLSAEAALEVLSYRLELLDSHKDTFFKGQRYDCDALTVAVILDTLFANIQLPEDEDDKEEGYVSTVPGIPDELIARAEAICEGSNDLIDNGAKDSEAPVESYFLAHLNSIETLDDYVQDMDEYSEDRLEDIHDNELRKIKSWLAPKTTIGKTLNSFVADVEGKLPDFAGDKVLAQLGISADDKVIASCVRYVYQQNALTFSNLPVHETYELATEQTIQDLEYRLSLINSYMADFFGGSDFERDSVIAALILDTHLAEADKFIETGTLGIDAEIIGSAATFYEQANELHSYDECLAENVDHEALFIAHVSATAELYALLERDGKDEPSAADLRKVRDETFAVISKFICVDSAIGQKLSSFVDEILAEIEAKRESAQILPFKKPGASGQAGTAGPAPL